MRELKERKPSSGKDLKNSEFPLCISSATFPYNERPQDLAMLPREQGVHDRSGKVFDFLDNIARRQGTGIIGTYLKKPVNTLKQE